MSRSSPPRWCDSYQGANLKTRGDSISSRQTPASADSFDWLLLGPAVVFLCLVWAQHYPESVVVGTFGTGFNAAADLLFVLAGWRTANIARSPDPSTGLALLRKGALRFLPLHLVVLAISGLCALEFRRRGLSLVGSMPAMDLLSFFANLFLVQGWFPAGVFLYFWNPHLWVMGAGLLWLQCAPGIVRAMDRALERASPWTVAGSIWLAGLILTLALRRSLPEQVFDCDTPIWILMSPLLRLWEFSLGALCRLAWERPLRRNGLRENLLRPRNGISVALAAVGGVAATVGLSLDLVGGRAGAILCQPFFAAPLWGILLLSLGASNRRFPCILSSMGRAGIAVLLLSPWSFWIAVALHKAGANLFLPVLYPLVALALGALVHKAARPGRALLDKWWPRY